MRRLLVTCRLPLCPPLRGVTHLLLVLLHVPLQLALTLHQLALALQPTSTAGHLGRRVWQRHSLRILLQFTHATWAHVRPSGRAKSVGSPPLSSGCLSMSSDRNAFHCPGELFAAIRRQALPPRALVHLRVPCRVPAAYPGAKVLCLEFILTL